MIEHIVFGTDRRRNNLQYWFRFTRLGWFLILLWPSSDTDKISIRTAWIVAKILGGKP